MEAEHVDACEGAKEAIWLKKFLHDLEAAPNMNMPITLYCDNSGTIVNFKELDSHKQTYREEVSFDTRDCATKRCDCHQNHFGSQYY